MKGISQIIHTKMLNLWKLDFAFSSFLIKTKVAQSAWKSIKTIANKPVIP